MSTAGSGCRDAHVHGRNGRCIAAAAARDSSPRRGAARRGAAGTGDQIMPLCQLWVQQRPCAALSGGALQLSQNRRRWMELPQGLAALRLELRFARCFRSRR